MSRSAVRVPAEAPRVATADLPGPPWHEEGPGPVWLEPGERERVIAEAAYFRAQARGFAPGHELEDWVEAEREVDAMLGREDSADA